MTAAPSVTSTRHENRWQHWFVKASADLDAHITHICYICYVVQLHFYLPDDMAEALKSRAAAKGQSVSRYVAELARRELASGWPEGFFEKVVGAWQGPPLTRPLELDYEQRESLGFRLNDK